MIDDQSDLLQPEVFIDVGVGDWSVFVAFYEKNPEIRGYGETLSEAVAALKTEMEKS